MNILKKHNTLTSPCIIQKKKNPKSTKKKKKEKKIINMMAILDFK